MSNSDPYAAGPQFVLSAGRPQTALSFVNDEEYPPRPRNRPRKKRRLRSTTQYVLRLAVLAVSGILAAYIAFCVIVKIVHPYQLGHEVGEQVATLRSKLTRENQENAALQERLQFLTTKEGAEVAARRSGYHRPGEMVYLMPDDSPSPNVGDATGAAVTR
jgi:cell division protein FtsL